MQETPKKSNVDVAKEVLAGKWGETSTEIRKNLENAGYTYADVYRCIVALKR